MTSSSPSSKKAPLVIGAAVLVVLVIAFYVLRPNSKPMTTSGLPTSANTENQANVQDLVNKLVAKKIPVKTDEIPVVAEIKEVASLRQANPAFYAGAKNGDLIYIWSDRVLLFSVKQDKVLQFMPLIPEGGNRPATPPQQVPIVLTPGATLAEEAATVEIRNATGKAKGATAINNTLTAAGLKTLAPVDAAKVESKILIMPIRLDRPMGNTLKTLLDTTGGQIVAPDQSYGPFKGDVLVIVGSQS